MIASFSNAITPSFLAFVANPTISAISPGKSTLGGNITSLNNPIASFKTAGGKLKTIAPEVPPRTINAAVICSNCPMLPPSIACPRRIKPTPKNKPTIAKISMNYAPIIYLYLFISTA